MSVNPIPQLVNISHALQSSFVQKLRSEVKGFNESAKLNETQIAQINKYITSLESAFSEFTRDNEHIERREAHVTAADVQLYNGLKTMYADYLSQLVKLKQRSVNQEEHVSGDQPVDYIRNELPYKQPSERKAYIDKLAQSPTDTVAAEIKKSDQLLEGVVNLSVLDSTVGENIQSYITLLKTIGYSDQEISKRMPHASNGKDSSTIQATKVAEPTNAPSDEPKKKISFSKYLKKGDINDSVKRTSEDDDLGDKPAKRMKPTEISSSSVASILKKKTIKKKRNPIRFVSDEKLLTVYGDELPSKGLVVSPKKLKKILKPFKDGEPREITYSAWKNQKVRELSKRSHADDSDVVDIKGGPIPSESRAPLGYRLNFTAFSKSLTKLPAEPTDLDDSDPSLYQKPLIVRAFGKNCLLLQKDRGGIPYKLVPEVHVNDYPIRPISN
ncbi:LANO_0G07844g1_1 [Lachancea nothofagi CBS 11611]|uniref:LANO_0G07844g1_1 n=1 Tax=Lachancea nothofagi CBS 11611 TaxID=1266666 RepID=A0A1G4KHL0_9SACH|nr:LANO_0G07844g1_1 [Lachancea nothofagi CBS 11611]